jgi:hypothetical protein
MKLFKKTKMGTVDLEKVKAPIEEAPSPTPKPEEEWIWVEGYKGTNKIMKCFDYQYELGVQHNMPEDQEIKMRANGFHLCLTLNDVFEYYPIGNGCRFFKVKALVRKSDKNLYGTYEKCKNDYGLILNGHQYDKLVAKSIIFESELTIDEILEGTEAQNLPMQYKQLAIEFNIDCAKENYQIDTLIADGYSKPFACHIVKNTNSFYIAHAVGSQPDLSMDMKVLTILYNR